MLSDLWAGSRKSEDCRGKQLGVTHSHQLTSLQGERMKTGNERLNPERVTVVQ